MQTFGCFLRTARQSIDLGQRELARKLDISAAYLNDIEKSKRPAPTNDILFALCDLLQLEDADLFFELAGRSKKKLPPDLEALLLSHQELLSFNRKIKNLNIAPDQIAKMEAEMMTKNCSAIIIAAGLGSRLETLTANNPKCMLKLGEKTILEHQLAAFRANNITNVSVVRGYKNIK